MFAAHNRVIKLIWLTCLPVEQKTHTDRQNVPSQKHQSPPKLLQLFIYLNFLVARVDVTQRLNFISLQIMHCGAGVNCIYIGMLFLCCPLFLLWNTQQKYILRNVSDKVFFFLHTMKVNRVQCCCFVFSRRKAVIKKKEKKTLQLKTKKVYC